MGFIHPRWLFEISAINSSNISYSKFLGVAICGFFFQKGNMLNYTHGNQYIPLFKAFLSR